jgi:tetratricopeptide (TPR) repeat protein
LGRICVDGAEAAAEAHDFVTACRLVDALSQRPKAHPTGYEPQAERVRQLLPDKQLAYAGELADQGVYEGALKHYEEVPRLHPDLDEAKQEAIAGAARARIALAAERFNQRDLKGALALLKRVVDDPEAPDYLRSQSYDIVPQYVASEARTEAQHLEYEKAFDLLKEAREQFDRTDTQAKITEVQRSLEREVFGMEIRDTPTLLDAPSRTGDATSAALREKATVTVCNEGCTPARVAFRGRQKADAELTPGREQTFTLEPGRYVWAVSSPGLRPAFGPLELTSGTYKRSFCPGADGSIWGRSSDAGSG